MRRRWQKDTQQNFVSKKLECHAKCDILLSFLSDPHWLVTNRWFNWDRTGTKPFREATITLDVHSHHLNHQWSTWKNRWWSRITNSWGTNYQEASIKTNSRSNPWASKQALKVGRKRIKIEGTWNTSTTPGGSSFGRCCIHLRFPTLRLRARPGGLSKDPLKGKPQSWSHRDGRYPTWRVTTVFFLEGDLFLVWRRRW